MKMVLRFQGYVVIMMRNDVVKIKEGVRDREDREQVK